MNINEQSSDFTKQLIEILFKSLEEGTKKGFRMVWDIVTSFLLDHWMAVIVILGVVLIYAIGRALTGSWWILGHVLYNYLYFGSIFIIASIWGPEVFAGTYVEIGLLLLYIICYILVGKILSRTGLRSHR